MDLLALVWLIILFASWPLLLAALVGMALLAGWRRRWRRAGLLLAALAGLLIWAQVLPAILRHRLQTALDRGSLVGAVPETLAGAQVLLLGARDSRMDASPCATLLGAAGVGRLWQGPRQAWALAPRPEILGAYIPAAPGCAFRDLLPDEVAQPEWLLAPEDHDGGNVLDNPAFGAVVAAHLGDYAARRVALSYLLAPMDASGQVLAEQAALAGFQVEVDRRPWWWSPLAPALPVTLRPAADPALDRLRRLTCGGDWPCDY